MLGKMETEERRERNEERGQLPRSSVPEDVKVILEGYEVASHDLYTVTLRCLLLVHLSSILRTPTHLYLLWHHHTFVSDTDIYRVFISAFLP